MRKNLSKRKLLKIISSAEEELLDTCCLLEVIKNSCTEKAYTNHEVALEFVLKKQYEILDSMDVNY